MPLAERNGLVLDYLTREDAATVSPLFLKSFHVYPFFQHMQPDTPAAHKGWTDATLIAVSDPTTICLKVTDTGIDQIVAHGRWIKAPPKEVAEPKDQPGLEEGRWPDSFMDSCDMQLAERMFEAFDQNRMDHMGTKRHMYMELLLTHPDYQGKGCASIILRHGCEIADHEQVQCYIDSSPMGKPIYEKFGWKFEHEENFEHGITYCFGIREPQKA